MNHPKLFIWLLVPLLLLPGCTLTRYDDISAYDPANPPQPAIITPTSSPAVTAPPALPPVSTPAMQPSVMPTQPAQPQSGAATELVPPAPPPTSITQPQPTAMTQPQPTAMTQPQPTAMTQPQPTAVTQPQPTAMTQPQPTAMTQPQPTAAPPQTTPTVVIQVKPAVLPTDTPAPPLDILQPVHIPLDATFGFCYRTQPGETIDVLAQKYSTTAWAINRTNDLHQPFFIKPQQTIFVPILPGNGPNTYQVELGDTLAVIAERCKIPENMLARVNNLPVGAPLYLPAGAVVTLADGMPHILAQDTVVVRNLVVPIPPFPPPSRYQYPTGPIPILPFSTPYPIHK